MKARGLAAAVLCAVLLQQSGAVAVQSDDEGRIRAVLGGIERALRSNDRTAYLGLLAATADQTRAENFMALEFRPGVTRAVVIERDRQPLAGTLPGLGYHVLVDVFVESGDRARIASWQLDIKRVDDGEWRVADEERVSTVENLYRLSLNPTRQFRAKNFTVRSEDLELRLVDGMVFTVDTDQGVTGLVLTGRGEMRFEPAPETEKGQVRIFAGDTKIETRFDAAFVRVGDLSLHANPDELVAVTVDPRELRRADEVFRVESGRSYALELGDLTAETWSLAPAPATSSPKSGRPGSTRSPTCAAATSPRTSACSTGGAAATSPSTRRSKSWRRAAASTTKTNRRPTMSSNTTSTSPRCRPPIASGSRGGPGCGFGCSRPPSPRSRCASPIR